METLFLKGLLSARAGGGGEREGISERSLRTAEPELSHPRKAARCPRKDAAPGGHSGLSLSSAL